ncbi:GDP-mannose 4,6-dehydratase [Candidatus Pacearchaeota archaeon]|nr:GDP-mannose 4,6-dehydratase [Candidatus Pacearchaeota archaeon]
MQKKVAFITGIGGQDGSYLAEFLLEKGYLVRGIIRRASYPNTSRFEHLLKKYGFGSGDENNPFIVKYADLTDPASVNAVLDEFKPDEIYNIAAQSHVGISFDNPHTTISINTLGVLNILEYLRRNKSRCKFYQASSSEMFGISPPPQNEETPMLPQSPYGIAKLASYHLTRLYRNAYGIFACNGILFNHECVSENIPIIVRNKSTQVISVKRIKDLRRARDKGSNIQQWVIGDVEIWDGDNFVDLLLVTATKRKKDDESFSCKTMNTRHGIIEATNHHNMLLSNEHKIKSKEVMIGDELLHRAFPEFSELSSVTNEEALFLGMMVGDGYISKEGGGQFTNNNPEVMGLFEKIWKKVGLGTITKREFKTEYGRAAQAKLNSNHGYLRLLREEIYTYDGFKKIPDRILNAGKEAKRAFLSGYNLTDGLKSNPCTYEFKNFKTNSVILAQGLLLIMNEVTGQDYNITFEYDEKNYGYYSINLLSPIDNSAKEMQIIELLSSGMSQREICRQSGISRTFIRKIQNGGHAETVHHLALEKNVVKKMFYHTQQPVWVYDIETSSGKFMAGTGNIVIANSPRRGHNFVTKKVTNQLAKILVGEDDELVLGNLDSKRDWGFSKEYVQVMWAILQHYEPDDFVIATQETHTVEEFVKECFSLVGLDYKDFLKTNQRFRRPAEVPALLGDATKARKVLGWTPKVKFKEIVRMMVIEDIKKKLIEKNIVPIESGVERDDEFYLEKARELAKRIAHNKFGELAKKFIEVEQKIKSAVPEFLQKEYLLNNENGGHIEKARELSKVFVDNTSLFDSYSADRLKKLPNLSDN